MDRDVLEKLLGEDLSLERIGKIVGRHPSTVGYWVRKHGLVAVGRAKHASKGGVEGAQLASLAAEGRTLKEIASETGVSSATVRYWMSKHGLSVQRSRRSPVVQADGRIMCLCHSHGETTFVREGRGYLRCAKCRVERISRRRRRAKQLLVDEAGGECVLCGYDRCLGALEFHHLDPSSKEFTLSAKGASRSIDNLRREAAKCVLLCSNCHAEVEAGLVPPPA